MVYAAIFDGDGVDDKTGSDAGLRLHVLAIGVVIQGSIGSAFPGGFLAVIVEIGNVSESFKLAFSIFSCRRHFARLF